MRNLTLRLLFIYGFLLLNIASLYSQCPDTQPVVIGPDVVRAGQSVTYTTNLIPNHSYLWTVTGGTISGSSDQYQVTVNWSGTPGTGSIYVSEGNNLVPLCTWVQSLTISVEIQPQLHAYYYYQFQTGTCFYNGVDFFGDVSVHPGQTISYSWDFGDGSTSILQNPPHTYPTISGVTYTVVLTITNQDGQTDMITDYVYVDPDKYQPIPVLATPAYPNCLNSPFSFSAVGSQPTTMTGTPETFLYVDWEFGDGTTIRYEKTGSTPPPLTTTHTYTTFGQKTVTLTLTNTIYCHSYKTIQIDIPNTMPVAGFTFNQTCVGVATSFTDGSTTPVAPLTITDWTWNWNDGTSNAYNVITNPPPVPVTHTFSDLIVHNVSLTVKNSNGCESTISKPLQAQPAPSANFTTYLQEICEGSSVHFKDLSNPLTGSPIQSYLWDFGDPSSGTNNTSTLAEPFHTFSGAADYTVTLTVTNTNGCPNTKPKPITVSPLPSVSFISTPTGNGPYELLFDATVSVGVNNNINWNFGDGQAGVGNDVVHTYSGQGPYDVQCHVWDVNTGCRNTTIQSVNFPRATPIATFTANPQYRCENLQISFISDPPGTGGVIDDEKWTWDDGTFSTFTNGTPLCCPAYPIHTFAIPAGPGGVLPPSYTFNVRREVNLTTPAFYNDYILAVTIYPNPTAGFTYFTGPYQGSACDNQEVSFNPDASHTNSDPPGSITEWRWDFGDPGSGASNTSTDKYPTHVFLYSRGSVYTVKLQVKDNLHGCWSTVAAEQIITLSQPIPVNINFADNACVGSLISFIGNSGLPPSDFDWSWYFSDDGSTSQNPGSVDHLCSLAGTYNVTLTMTEHGTGCSKSLTVPFTVIPKPLVNFTFSPSTSSCFGTEIQYSSTSQVVPGTDDYIVSWEWDFNDNTAGVGSSIAHTFQNAYQAGGWDVKLTVTTSRGCTDSKTIHVTQIPAPLASFSTVGFLCEAPQTVQFHNSSQENGGTAITALYWDFGDPASSGNNHSTATDPTHIYNNPGDYNVTLKATNADGCANTTNPPVIVHINSLPKPDFNAPAVCFGENTIFTGIEPGPSPITSWAWDFGDGGTSPLPNPQHQFATAGSHLVTLVVVNSNGCTNTITKTVTVNPKPVVDFISTSPFCQNSQVTFTSQAYVPAGFTSFINDWVWKFGDGTLPYGSGPVVTHTFLDASISHTVTLITTTTDGCVDSISKVVTGIPAPLADFTYIGAGCLNQPLNFVDNSQTNGGGTITQWLWNFDDPGSGTSNTSTLPSPNHSFTSAGPHHVTLTVTNVNGCAATKFVDLTISDKPVASFTAANSCLGNLTSFTDASTTPTGTIVTWAWSFGDGGTAVIQSPTYSFSTAGMKFVTLTVTNSNGCTQTVTNPVEVYPQPVTSFGFSSPSCAGSLVTFTDMSTTGHGFIVRRIWNFDDGNIVNTTSPSITHQFTGGGNFNVILTVKTSDSCTNSKMIPVSIQFSPVASFTATNSLCILSPVQFHDNSQTNGGGPVTQWNWNFGDAGSGVNNTSTQQNPIHNFSAAGSFWVHLTIANADGCIGRDSLQVTINSNPVANFTATNACQGNATTFTDNSTSASGSIVSWLWNFGDGGSSVDPNPTYTYTNGGPFNVTLTITTEHGCVHTITKPVQVWPKPTVTFGFTSPSCSGTAVTFTDLTTTSHGFVTARNWDFGDGNTGSSTTATISHTYTSGGPFPVTLTVTTSDNCTSLNTLIVQIQYNPISGFQWSPITCAMNPVQFTDYSQQNGGGQITQWLWNFNDPGSGGNNTSTQKNPTHSFSAAGSYVVHLKVTNTSGCYKDSSAQITIDANPTADFTSTSVCKGSPTVFTDNTSGGTIVTWLWTFGDGGTSNVQNPSYTYANAGTYPVTLTAKTAGGCEGVVAKSVTIYGAPVAQFSFSSPTCSNDSVQFTDLSTTAHGSIETWLWDFDDGNTQPISWPANPNVKHKYTNGGSFNVKLTITTSDQCEAIVILPVTVESKPVANFSNDPGTCAGMENQFNDLSQANGGTPIVAWLWDFGDPTSGSNNTSTLKNPTHSFTAAGPFSVKLQVTNGTGCYDTIRNQVTANASPVPLFTFDTACIASPTQFHDGSTSPSGTINAWLWNFGDPSSGPNNTSTLQNPTHDYAAPGNYMVTLSVTNTNNCSRDTVKQIAVSPKPVALFQYAAACALDSTTFTDLSIAPLSQIVAWSWDFGDGGTATIQNPKHKYATATTFPVKLVVTNFSGCKDSVNISVLVHPKPAAAFQYASKFCPKGQVTFQDMSQASGASITDHLWNFEAGATSTVPNPVYTFPVTDTIYPVSLIVIDTYGCKDTVIDSVHVKPAFKFTFTNDTVCFGYTSHFHPVNQALGDSLYSPNWEFGDPNSGPANTSSLYNSSHNFTAPGLFYVKLKVFNTDNCSDSVFKTVQVYALPKPAFSYVAPQCDSVLHFNDTTSNYGNSTVTSWEWNFGDNSPNVIIPSPGPGDTSHIYSTPGDYLVTLIIKNSHGCVDSITQGVTRLPCIKASYTYSDTLRCANYMITFQDTSIPVSRIRQWTWTWDDGSDTTYTTFAPSVKHMFTVAGSYNVKLKIKAIVNTVNVFDSLSQPVVIHPTPTTLFSDVPVCLHQQAVFKDTSLTFGEAVTAWKWNFGEPSSIPRDTSSLKNPTHIYATRDTFDVKLVNMNKFGCKDSLIKPIQIYGLPVASFRYTAACTGDPTMFRDTSSIADTTIGFWHWNFGDPSALKDTSILKDPIFKYKTAGNYIVRLIVRDHFGCRDTVDSTVAVHITPVAAFTLINGYEGTQGKVKLNNFSTGASEYNWDFGNGKTSNDTNPVATFTEDGTYTIKLISTNTFGCTDTTYYQYKILFRGLFVPNAFAPTSGNMAVRLFKPVGINLKTYNIRVFDNWGHLLWESNKLDNNGAPLDGWDGTYNGNLMPQGNYFWKATATFVDDSAWTGSDTGVQGGGGTMGTVILVR